MYDSRCSIIFDVHVSKENILSLKNKFRCVHIEIFFKDKIFLLLFFLSL